MKGFSGRYALVTGSSRGIGRAIALRLADEGCNVAVHYNKNASYAEDVARTVEEKGVRSILLKGDISREEDVLEMFRLLMDKFGHLDFLVNNAGRFISKDIEELSPEDFDGVIKTNVNGTFMCSMSAIKIMEEQGAGRIVNIGTASAEKLMPVSKTLLYSISKAGVILITRSLAKRYFDKGILVNSVSPGIVENSVAIPEMNKRRIVGVKDVVDAVLFLLSDNAKAISGSNIVVDAAYFIGG